MFVKYFHFVTMQRPSISPLLHADEIMYLKSIMYHYLRTKQIRIFAQ